MQKHELSKRTWQGVTLWKVSILCADLCALCRETKEGKGQGMLQKALQDKAELQARVQRLQTEVRPIYSSTCTVVLKLTKV